MSATYRTDHAADPELYGRLMRERYGLLPEVIAERDRQPAPARSPLMTPTTDPDAALHRAQLEAAVGRPRPILAAKPKRTLPFPDATWCDSCDSWCDTLAVCRCNNR